MPQQLALEGFEGLSIAKVSVALGGHFELVLSDLDHVEFLESLSIADGARGLRLLLQAADGEGPTIPLRAATTAWTVSRRTDEQGVLSLIGKPKITVDGVEGHRSPEDDEPADPDD